jgi:hypothetical protein
VRVVKQRIYRIASGKPTLVFGAVRKKPGGVGFNFKNWYQFLMIIRYFARTLGVKARDIERTLFVAHKEYQKGTLYRTSGGRLSNRASHPTAQSRS